MQRLKESLVNSLMGRTPTHLASRAAGADEDKQQATTFWGCDLRKLMLGGAR